MQLPLIAPLNFACCNRALTFTRTSLRAKPIIERRMGGEGQTCIAAASSIAGGQNIWPGKIKGELFVFL